MKNQLQRLVIVGNGLASQRLVSELLKRDHRWHITILSSEPVPGYNRIMLSSLLAGTVDRENLTAQRLEWYRENNIDLRLGSTVSAVDAATRRIMTTHGETFAYDALVLATGSRAKIPDLPGAGLDGVLGFRTVADVDRMLAHCEDAPRVIVSGAGLLGIEAAAGLAHRGARVTLLHRNAVLMNRQIDATASQMLTLELERRGIDIINGVEVEALTGAGNTLSAVRLTNGRTLHCSMAVFATGIEPVRVDIIEGESRSLRFNRGIVVDQHMTTTIDSIYALGECAEFNGNTYGLVAPIWEQASVLADTLCGGDRYYREPDFITKLKVSGMDVHVMGDINSEGESLTLQFPQQGIYRRLIVQNNRIKAALLVGDVQDSQWYFDRLQQQCDISHWRSTLIFGQPFCRDEPAPHTAPINSAA